MALENPALNERSFLRGIEESGAEPRGMTASGTYATAGLLLVIVVAAAAFGWSQVEIVSVDGRQEALTPAWTWLVFLLTLIVGIVGAFAYRAAPITSVLYALGEGSLLGIASRYYELRYEGIVSQALVAVLHIRGCLPPLQPPHRQGHVPLRNRSYSGDGVLCCSTWQPGCCRFSRVDLRFLYAPLHWASGSA